MHIYLEVLSPGATLWDQFRVGWLLWHANELRQGRKHEKDSLRQAMLAFMNAHTGSAQAEERQRSAHLKNVYQEGLSALVDTDAIVNTLKRDALQLGLDVTSEAGKVTISLQDNALTDVLAIHHGRGAFVLHLGVGGDIRRPVYLKKGTQKQYVEDDHGVMTRRYAYRAMNKAQYHELRHQGFIEGRKGLFDPISNTVRSFHHLQHGAPASLGEAIYIHQRYGSGEEQRGVCLASTPHNVVSDAGYQFGGDMPYRIAVDLARVHGVRLYNLYQNPEAWIGLNFYIRGGNKLTHSAEQTRVGLLKSMLKNTELYLERLDRDWVCQAHVFDTDSWTLVYRNISRNASEPEPPIENPVIHGRN